MTIRAAGRFLWFAWEAVLISINYLFTAAFVPASKRRLARAEWLSRSSRRHLRIFGYSAKVSGPIPKRGLLISNHLSYLDILAISSVTPAVFVSKAEVRHWPLFGWFAKIAGTVFVERERRTQVGKVNREIEAALADGALVVLFPEGTSSNGKDILPFRTSLLEPAASGNHEISTCGLYYELEKDDGNVSNEICYWGDHVFFPHLVNLAGKRRIHATLHFGIFHRTTRDRKELAKELHTAVSHLKKSRV